MLKQAEGPIPIAEENCVEVYNGDRLPFMTILIKAKSAEGQFLAIQPEFNIRKTSDSMADAILDVAGEMGRKLLDENGPYQKRLPCGRKVFYIPAPMLPDDLIEAYEENLLELEELAGEAMPTEPTDLFYAAAIPRI